MSLILDALKKLDREKSSRRERTANIAAGILRPGPPRPGRKNFVYVVAVSLSALAAAGVTYAVMEYGFPEKGGTTKPGPAAAVNPLPPKQQVAAAIPPGEPVREVRPEVNPVPQKILTPIESKRQPVSAAPPAKNASPPAARLAASASPPEKANPLPPREQAPPARDSREPAPAARDDTRGVPVKNQNPPEIKNAALPPVEARPAQKAVPAAPSAAPATPIKPADAASAGLPADPPPLRLSGIVWHEEPSARRAVVNGTFASEGSVIEGVKVVEIHPNRVTFSHNGRSFEIVMFR